MGKQITNLTEITSADFTTGDFLLIVDLGDTSSSDTGKTKKITKTNILKAANAPDFLVDNEGNFITLNSKKLAL
tara:strand:+ start:259 stop:480 length:222 start_codon:yes stop_codon:yes gene_type:complete